MVANTHPLQIHIGVLLAKLFQAGHAVGLVGAQAIPIFFVLGKGFVSAFTHTALGNSTTINPSSGPRLPDRGNHRAYCW